MDEEALKKDLPVRMFSQASNPSHTRCSPTYHVLYITQANNFTYLKLHKMGPGLKSSSKTSWACKTRRLVQWCVVLLPLRQKLPKPTPSGAHVIYRRNQKAWYDTSKVHVSWWSQLTATAEKLIPSICNNTAISLQKSHRFIQVDLLLISAAQKPGLWIKQEFKLI